MALGTRKDISNLELKKSSEGDREPRQKAEGGNKTQKNWISPYWDKPAFEGMTEGGARNARHQAS